MGSGIIFVVIMGLWAAILVPQWLRSHDAAAETKSVDRFSTAMRTLSRRNSQPAGTRDVLMPGRSRSVELSGGRAPSASARRARAAQAAKLRRRRTAILALVGFLAVVALAAVVGAAPLWLPLVVLLGTGGYLVHLRIDAVNTAALQRRQARASRSAARPAAPATRRAPLSVPVARPTGQAPIWPVTAATAAAPSARDAVPALAEGEWAPTPVVLPTYVTAPPATAVPRVIDLTHPGSWSAAHMLDQAAARHTPDPDEIFDGRALPEQVVAEATREEFAAEHEAVAATVAGSGTQSFLEDDVVFDQYDDEAGLGFLERRASGH